jgi:hypothetical protein
LRGEFYRELNKLHKAGSLTSNNFQSEQSGFEQLQVRDKDTGDQPQQRGSDEKTQIPARERGHRQASSQVHITTDYPIDGTKSGGTGNVVVVVVISVAT